MSQWYNKFSVLSPNNNIDSIKPCCCSVIKETVTEILNMSPSNWPSSTLSSSSLPDRVYVRSNRIKFSTHLQLQLKTLYTGVQLDLKALLDSGATGLFLSSSFVERNNLNTRVLPRPIPVYNVDGTLNQGGSIREEVDVIMTYQDHTEKAIFAVCDLGDKDAIIGHTWLHCHNPEIDWQTGQIQFTRCPPKCRTEVKRRNDLMQQRRYKATSRRLPLPILQDEIEQPQAVTNSLETFLIDGDRLFITSLHDQHSVHINATQTISQKLAEEQSKSKSDCVQKTFEEIVPAHYHNFKTVFSKESFDELPVRKPWDHAIELKPGSEPHRCKIYPLSPN